MTEPITSAPIPDPVSPSTGSAPLLPQAAAPHPSPVEKDRTAACATGTPDWLRTRFSDGFAAHEFG